MAKTIKQRMLKDKKKLLMMYNERKMSLTDIGEKYGCSRQYVQMVFIALGIARRERQEALRQSPKKRKSKFNFRPEHDIFISENFSKMTDVDMAARLSKPVNAVTYRRLIVLGKKKVSRKNFTNEEDDFILKNYRNLTDIAIARYLDRSLISVTHHRNRILNRPKRTVKPYSEKEDFFIKQNYLEMTDGQIADRLNRSKASISIHRHEVLGLGKMFGKKNKGNTN